MIYAIPFLAGLYLFWIGLIMGSNRLMGLFLFKFVPMLLGAAACISSLKLASII